MVARNSKNKKKYINNNYLSQIEKYTSSQECLVKFFIELSESKINISKLRPFNEYKEEFSKTKLKNLKNIIKIADLVSKGKMSFEQHIKFVKKGLKLYEEQYSELDKIKKEKKKLKIKKEEKEKVNHVKNTKKFRTIKKMKFLGKKRNLFKINYNCNMTKELICSIDEFIFHKREVKLINGYDAYFNDMKKKISETLINTNGLNVRKYRIYFILLQALLKLYKHMNNSRNFTQDISNKNSFISLKNEINSKIKESLFDENSLFLSSSFNYFCSNYNSSELSQEGINISNLLNNMPLLDEDEALGNLANNIFKKEKNKSLKKLSESEDDKSSSFGSKQTKMTQNDENKHKFNIGLIKYSDLLNLLNINENNNNELSKENNEKILSKIREMEKELKNGENGVKNENLRKNVCLKLYKAFHFALKKFALSEDEIKTICLYIEKQGRIIDNSMNEKYKEFIENVFKKISFD